MDLNAQAKQLLNRIYQRDTSLWTSDAAVAAGIKQRLGWLDAIAFSRNHIERLQEFTRSTHNSGFDRVLLLGMGGSSLAPEVFAKCFATKLSPVKLRILDSTFPDSVRDATEFARGGRTLFIVSSKSGTTAETLAFFKHFWHFDQQQQGRGFEADFVAITDAESSLHTLAAQRKFRDLFLNPKDIGGRYSGLSFFGLVPAALLGIDITRLLPATTEMEETVNGEAVRLGAFIGSGLAQGRDKLTLALSPEIESLGSWIEQLVAESTGKDGNGIVPIDGEPLRVESYSSDRLFVSIDLKGDTHSDPQIRQKLQGLELQGHPVLRQQLADVYQIGAEFMIWQLATAMVASLMGVNPFDEPDVNSAKKRTTALLEQGRTRESSPAPTKLNEAEIQLTELLQQASATDYIAILAYLPDSGALKIALQEFRQQLMTRTQAATCLNFGPRYLHSSGQLHKGGKANGKFIIFTADPADPLPIPEERFGFDELVEAQAQGDLEVLRGRNRDVILVNLGQVGGAAGVIQDLAQRIKDQPTRLRCS